MKTLKHDELFRNLSEFLQAKGIDFKEGAYTLRIRQGCRLLTDTVNAAQRGLTKAKTSVETTVDGVRQVIHEKTAPRTAKRPGPQRSAKPGARSAKATAAQNAPRPGGSAKPRKTKSAARPARNDA